jgi:hypothetical protein
MNIFFILVLSLSFSLFSEPLFKPLALDAPGYEWMDEQIEKEFSRFEKTGITLAMINETQKISKITQECRRYRILSSRVYGPEGQIKDLLEAVLRYYSIPNIDFLYYLQDVLREEVFTEIPRNAPIFVSAKNRFCDRVILFVDWYYHIKDEKGGWNGLIASINTHQETWPWNRKKAKLFWRGANTDGYYTKQNWTEHPRGRIVYLAQHAKELIDAAFHQICPERSDKYFRKETPTKPFVTVVDHLAYKYQLLVDGVTCTYPGTQWRLLSGCATFKQESDDVMWFFPLLEPWVHYIPVKQNLSDVFEKLLWAQKNDAWAHQIAQNARTFALNNIMPEHILLYCAKTLLKYASLQTFTPL